MLVMVPLKPALQRQVSARLGPVELTGHRTGTHCPVKKGAPTERVMVPSKPALHVQVPARLGPVLFTGQDTGVH